MSRISQGLRGTALEEGLQFRRGNLRPMCPLANQSKAQSPQDRRDWARWGSRCQKPMHSLLGEPCWVEPWPGTHPTKGWDALTGLEPSPPEQAVLSSCHSARQCRPLRTGQQDPTRVGCPAVLLSSSLAPRLPTVHLAKGPAPHEGSTKKAHHPLQCLPYGLWLSRVGDTGLPLGRDDGPGPECTVGAPGQGPPLS